MTTSQEYLDRWTGHEFSGPDYSTPDMDDEGFECFEDEDCPCEECEDSRQARDDAMFVQEKDRLRGLDNDND